MFDLVADVARYAEFLPWVVATRVRSDSETEMVADMLVGFKALREKFTSRVIKHRPEPDRGRSMSMGRCAISTTSGTSAPLPDGGCEIDFCVDFTFRNAMFEMLAGQYFDRAFRKMVGRVRGARRRALRQQQLERAQRRLKAHAGAVLILELPRFGIGRVVCRAPRGRTPPCRPASARCRRRARRCR